MTTVFRILGIVALTAGVVACNSSSNNNPSGGSNPSSSTITVTTSKGAPISEITVILSTGINSGGPTGVINSERTNGAGQVTFSNLPGNGQLCVYAATDVGGTVYKASHCASPFPATDTLKFGNMP